jgi:hypothetical protein
MEKGGMSRLVTRAALGGAGALLGLIGGALLIAPGSFLETSHIAVEHDPDLISELTAPTGFLLISSALMMRGAVRPRFADLALSIGAIVYGSYGLSRLVGMALHGVPSTSLLAAMVIELVLAGLLISLRLARPFDSSGLSPISNEARSHGL